MSNREIVTFLFFLCFSIYNVILLFRFYKDVKFYARNGWNFDQIRKGSMEIFDGDPPSGPPLKGRNRFFSMVFLVLGSNVVVSVLFFGGVLPALKRIL
ncbi:nitrate reductase NapE component [Labrenzia sp. EL_159]|nr:nitrate reductase NapE component [Labrenzia sp. EL_162]MBG6193089.1 nitrate reductase NapE component [Labrenzia sp. EL_159]